MEPAGLANSSGCGIQDTVVGVLLAEPRRWWLDWQKGAVVWATKGCTGSSSHQALAGGWRSPLQQQGEQELRPNAVDETSTVPDGTLQLPKARTRVAADLALGLS